MKKILLTLVPALMLLGSCAGAQPKVESNLFLEDTLAHEEIFGSIGNAFKKLPRNIGDSESSSEEPEPETPLAPKIAVQQSAQYDIAGKEGKFISVRFVAAVNLLDVPGATASWERTMHKGNGQSFKTSTNQGSTKAYRILADGRGGTITAGDGDFAGYNRFVVYTMKNIPVGEDDYSTDAVEGASKYYLKVRLTVNGVAGDKYYASSVDGEKFISFPASQSGYFMMGKINSVENSIESNDLSTVDSGNNEASFTYKFKANDYVTIVANTPSANYFKVLDYSDLDGEAEAKAEHFTSYGTDIKFKSDYDCSLLLSRNLNKLFFEDCVKYFISGSNNDWNSNPDAAGVQALELYDRAKNIYRITDVTFDAGDEFAIKDSKDPEHSWHTNSGWLWDKCGFTKVGNNVHVTTGGTYTVYFYLSNTNSPIGLELGDTVAPRGKIERYMYSNLNEWTKDTDYQFEISYRNIGELLNVQINEWDKFKVADDTWGNEINCDSDIGGKANVYFTGDDDKNIVCNEGCGNKYNLFLGLDEKLYIELS